MLNDHCGRKYMACCFGQAALNATVALSGMLQPFVCAGFGPFLTNGSNGCHPGGGWPYGMCYLARVGDPADAEVYAQGAAGAGAALPFIWFLALLPGRALQPLPALNRAGTASNGCYNAAKVAHSMH
jgi:hypothetical protein